MTAGERANAAMVIIGALATGLSDGEAAELAHVSKSTVRRRQRDPAFRRDLAEMQQAVVGEMVSRLSMNMGAAMNTLVELLGDPSGWIRLGAARALLEISLRYQQHHEASEAKWQDRESKLWRTSRSDVGRYGLPPWERRPLEAD